MAKKKEGINIECKACGNIFYAPAYRKDTAKFCSKECLNHKQFERRTLVCKGCDKEFIVSNSKRDKKFCSMECKSIKATNEKELRLQVKALNILKRGRNSSRNLKKAMSKLRKLFCDNCGYDKASYNIELHHIDENPCNNVMENLAVLCVMCHRDLHYGSLRYDGTKYYIKE